MSAKLKIQIILCGLMGVWLAGCCTPFHPLHPTTVAAPNEDFKETLPPYTIEPPDVLNINTVTLVPRPPYKIKALDIFFIQFPASPDALKKDDVDDLIKTGRTVTGNFSVEPEGTFDLGPAYGKVKVIDLTIEEARKVIQTRLAEVIKKELVETGKFTLSLSQSRGLQQILGHHLVGPDGTVGLGSYGSVMVTGLTIPEANAVIEAYLSHFLLNPEISLDVSGFNSKVYYLIYDGGGSGEQVFRVPVTGNETVLDAVGQVFGMNSFSSRNRIWVARPGHGETEEDTILPVDWKAITRGGSAKSNYQILPGDRIYIQAQPVVTFWCR
jgi:polysaccharide export outer membrane protein